MISEAVALGGPAPSGPAVDAAAAARRTAPSGEAVDLDAAVALALDLGRRLPSPAQGDTLTLWESLASLGAVDLTVARAVEPHVDALSILREAQRHGQVHARVEERIRYAEGLWGVYAAEGPQRLRATETHDGRWRLDGPKDWCSLGAVAAHALVTAWVDDTRRGLFSVFLQGPGVRPRPADGWVSRGLADVTSVGIDFDGAEADPVGEPMWYLTRPGFAWGGAGVAAIWYGGAVGVARRLRAASTRRTPDQVALAHLGAVDAALARARALLVTTAAEADDPETTPERADLVCQRVRQVVADTAEEVLHRVGHALGPGPLATDEEHARRVADLTVYLRQQHAERDQARLGETVLADKAGGWW